QIAPPGTTNDSPPSWEMMEALAWAAFQSEPRKLVLTISKDRPLWLAVGVVVEHPATMARHITNPAIRLGEFVFINLHSRHCLAAYHFPLRWGESPLSPKCYCLLQPHPSRPSHLSYKSGQ